MRLEQNHTKKAFLTRAGLCLSSLIWHNQIAAEFLEKKKLETGVKH